ncbi:MAG: NADH-quinone oxidoreductase subunit NuoF [Phycisphaerae bacterium]|nr:NADH-quinone oxidoreductase subunit NuoF [Phycisphaerae bacterium]
MRTLRKNYSEAADQWEALQTSSVPVLYVGAATCGRAAGAGEVIERLQTEIRDRQIAAQVVEVGCLGLCCLEPLVVVHKPGSPQVCYGRVDTDRIVHILDRYVLGDDPCAEWALGTMTPGEVDSIGKFSEHPMMTGQVRHVLRNCGVIDPKDMSHYLARDGYRGFMKALELGPDKTLKEVKKAGLRGRGGAGFPTWQKWQFCRTASGEPKYVICNADEGDPGAFMDRSIMEGDPYSVLEGMAIGAYVIGAESGYIYVRGEYPLAIRNLSIAIEQSRALGLLGDNILDSGFSFDLEIVRGAGAFVCGEETALIASVQGDIGSPRQRPPYPAQAGLWGKPTNINNVETWSNVPAIILRGGKQFSGIGTKQSKGTKVFSLVGKVRNTGLVEVPMGTTMREIVYDIGGGPQKKRTFKAVQSGGPSGGCIPAPLLDLPIDFDKLQEAGAMMGSGGLIVMDDHTCMVDVAKYFLAFLVDESCGKCTACREGVAQMHNILVRICQGEGRDGDIELLEQLGTYVKDTSLCQLGGTAPNPVLSTLRYFRDEYEAHIHDKTCRAGVCKSLVRFAIDPDTCKGCGLCVRDCPTDAISGEKKEPHHIDADLCVQCGVCYEDCPFDAVLVE